MYELNVIVVKESRPSIYPLRNYANEERWSQGKVRVFTSETTFPGSKINGDNTMQEESKVHEERGQEHVSFTKENCNLFSTWLIFLSFHWCLKEKKVKFILYFLFSITYIEQAIIDFYTST